MIVKKLKKNSKEYTLFRSKVRTRHPSHNILRTKLPLLPFKSVVRLGSTTNIGDTISNNGKRIECNTIEAIKNSASKLRMKECFIKAGVKTADFIYGSAGKEDIIAFFEECGTIVAKSSHGSRGQGNTLIKTREELDTWFNGKVLAHYLFEKFYNYSLEYRLHITTEGCFYTCRKALKPDAPESEKWRRHDDICIWYLEESEGFKKPISWDDIITDCVKALKVIGADVLSFDVKVQSEANNKGKLRDYQDYILIECNSASSFGDITAQKYIEEIPKILKRKYDSKLHS